MLLNDLFNKIKKRSALKLSVTLCLRVFQELYFIRFRQMGWRWL